MKIVIVIVFEERHRPTQRRPFHSIPPKKKQFVVFVSIQTISKLANKMHI